DRVAGEALVRHSPLSSSGFDPNGRLPHLTDCERSHGMPLGFMRAIPRARQQFLRIPHRARSAPIGCCSSPSRGERVLGSGAMLAITRAVSMHVYAALTDG